MKFLFHIAVAYWSKLQDNHIPLVPNAVGGVGVSHISSVTHILNTPTITLPCFNYKNEKHGKGVTGDHQSDSTCPALRAI